MLRAGDGGSIIAGADAITDFQDGTDVLGLSGPLTYNDLVITQGNGTDTATANTVIRTSSGEFLAVVLNTQAANVNYLDVSVLSTTALNLTGTPGDDVLLGASGNDSISGGGGSDIILGRDGNDTITVGGNGGAAFSTKVDGGAGTDRLDIAYSGITGLRDFTLGLEGSATITLTDANAGTISFTGFESLYVNGNKYDCYPDYVYANGSSAGIGKVVWGETEKTLYAFPGGFLDVGALKYGPGFFPGYTNGDDVEFVGSSGSESISINMGRTASGYPYRDGGSVGILGHFIINTRGGNDNISQANLVNGDSVDLGSGDDTIAIKYSDLATLSLSKLEGGDGTDTLDLTEATVSASQELTLNTGSATGFENLIGTSAAQVLKGDANANVIQGGGGTDTIYGYAGDDYLYAGIKGYGFGGEVDPASNDNTNDVLYGGDGNDHLIGSAGTNILDGGLGADTLKGGANSDTFVLRAGDGGSIIAGADTFLDFTVGTDVIRLNDGLTFSSLVISQGTGSHLADTIIQIGSTHEYLAVLVGVTSSTLVGSCFE